MGVLQHNAKRMPQVVFFDFVNINAVITDFAVLNIIKTVNQVGNRRLSGSGRTDKRNFLPRRRKQVPR